MTNSLNHLDDLEIYIEGEPLDAIKTWLLNVFPNGTVTRESKKGFRFDGCFEQLPTPITVVKNAGQTGFTSVWVQNRNTPWHDDIEMARDAYQHLSTTIRCIESAWQKGDDPDLWYELSAQGEKQITWKTTEE